MCILDTLTMFTLSLIRFTSCFYVSLCLHEYMSIKTDVIISNVLTIDVTCYTYTYNILVYIIQDQ